MPSRPAYDPWADLAARWPEVRVVLEPMAGRLLGELRYPVIALRAGSSSAQRRCTLAHEVVHLDRGTAGCGDGSPWSAREELLVHREAAHRLLPAALVRATVRSLGPGATPGELAEELHVDLETLATHLRVAGRGSYC